MSAEAQLDFRQAMSDFKAMFPHLGLDMIEKVLRQNNGVVDATIDHLLALSVVENETETSDYSTIPSVPAGNRAPPEASALNRNAAIRSGTTGAPRAVQPVASNQRASQPQNGPAVGRLIDFDEGSTGNDAYSTVQNSDYQRNFWEPEVAGARDDPAGAAVYRSEAPLRTAATDASSRARNPNVARSTASYQTPPRAAQDDHLNAQSFSALSNNSPRGTQNVYNNEPLRTSAGNASSGANSNRSGYEDFLGREPRTPAPSRTTSVVDAPRMRRAEANGVTSRPNDSAHERRASQDAGISVELLQEKLAENHFRRRSLMERSSSLRRPASSVPQLTEINLEETDEQEQQILGDEYLAIMLQNEEFVTSLHNDEDFMRELRRDALIGGRDETQRPQAEVERARFEHRKTVIDRAQRNRESFMQDHGDNQRSEAASRASISMYGSRRADEPLPSNADSPPPPPYLRHSSHSAGRLATGNGHSANSNGMQPAVDGYSLSGYGDDGVPDLDAFPHSRRLEPEDAEEMQKRLQHMQGSTRKKFTVLAKRFFSKKKKEEGSSHVSRQSGEASFTTFEAEGGIRRTSLRSSSKRRKQRQKYANFAVDNNSPPVRTDGDAEANADADADADSRPARRYNIDRH